LYIAALKLMGSDYFDQFGGYIVANGRLYLVPYLDSRERPKSLGNSGVFEFDCNCSVFVCCECELGLGILCALWSGGGGMGGEPLVWAATCAQVEAAFLSRLKLAVFGGAVLNHTEF
jgi:hypothetical protein